MIEKILTPSAARIEQMSEREAKDVLKRVMLSTSIAQSLIDTGCIEVGSEQYADGMQDVVDRTNLAFEQELPDII